MRVIALADSDSYAKWAAALLGRLPAEWQVRLVVVRTAKEPSAAQLATALHGSGISPGEVERMAFDSAVGLVTSERPDVVVAATIGPLADLLSDRILATSTVRPVVVSGIPGIALPARRKALVYRSQADLLVLHSKRELRHFARLAVAHGFRHEFALATLPFLSVREARELPAGGDVVFAAQAIVPPTRAERSMLLGWLVAFARSHPHRRLVIKVRALDGEGQTHDEADSYPELLRLVSNPPANLLIESGPMGPRLASAGGLVTVSSTAAIEAIALGVPVLVIDDFGTSAALINDVFIGSGLLGSARELIDGSLSHPRPEWLDDNYFHPESENTWLSAIESLVARNRAGQLAPRTRQVRGAGGSLRRAWDRKRVLGRFDRSLLGYVALVVGMPVRTLLLAFDELRALILEETVSVEPVALEHEVAAIAEAGESADRSR